MQQIRDDSQMKRAELFLACILLGLFFCFTLLVRRHLFDQFDWDTTVRLQDHISHSFDTGFSFFSLLGSAEVISLFLIPPVLLFYKWRGVPIFFTYGFGLFVEVVGKTFLEHNGPPHLFLRYDLDFSFPSNYIRTYHSYPSGHSYRTFFIVTVWCVFLFSTMKSKPLKAVISLIALSLCAIMVVSRVSLGEHWTTDVIGGAVLGTGLALISCTFRKLAVAHKR